MKRFLVYLRGWIDAPFNFLLVGILFVLVLFAIAHHYNTIYPNTVWVRAFGNIAGILLFALACFAGINIIRSRTFPIFIAPIEGFLAIILGGILSVTSFGLIIFLFVKTIFLLIYGK